LKLEIRRGDVWKAVLDPIKGSEQAGQRPCVVVSPDSMNQQLQTIIVVPLTTKKKNWPTRVDTMVNGEEGQALCEQIRTISRSRLKDKIGALKVTEVVQIRLVLRQMLFE
jgi:mRNA interferase MazF